MFRVYLGFFWGLVFRVYFGLVEGFFGVGLGLTSTCAYVVVWVGGLEVWELMIL